MSACLGPPQTQLPGAPVTQTVPAERVTAPESVRLSAVTATAYTPVETTTATQLVQRAADAVIQASLDSYNPDTRFARYFPPAPLPYICPEVLPSKEPAPSPAPCIPVVRYVGSSTSEVDGGAM